MERIQPVSLEGIKTVSLKERKSKGTVDLFGKRYSPGGSVAQFLEGLPHILGAQDLREVIERIVAAHQEGNTIILGMGAHVIKVGLSPIVIQLMER